jgi:hypothetical protein
MAKSKNTTFRFSATLTPVKWLFMNTVIFLPKDIIEALPKGRVRTKGTMNGAPFALAPQSKKDRGKYFSVGAPLRKAAKIKAGDKVEVIFKLVDPDKVDIPEELEALLAQDDAARKVWDEFTPGMQRSLIIYVTSVKNVDSRIKRSIELMEKAKARQLGVQKKKPHP